MRLDLTGQRPSVQRAEVGCLFPSNHSVVVKKMRHLTFTISFYSSCKTKLKFQFWVRSFWGFSTGCFGLFQLTINWTVLRKLPQVEVAPFDRVRSDSSEGHTGMEHSISWTRSCFLKYPYNLFLFYMIGRRLFQNKASALHDRRMAQDTVRCSTSPCWSMCSYS